MRTDLFDFRLDRHQAVLVQVKGRETTLNRTAGRGIGRWRARTGERQGITGASTLINGRQHGRRYCARQWKSPVETEWQ